MVKTLKFQDITVPAPGFGAMSFSKIYGPADDRESLQTLAKAVELGCTFWDTAVVYGVGHNESLIGEFVQQNNCRDKVFIASKCGFACMDADSTKRHVTNDPAHIAEYIEGTKERLGSYPDLYYLHRIDPNTPLEKSIPALHALKQQGKTKYIGLSECSAATLRKACSIAHIDAIQIDYSPWCTDHEDDGLIATAHELGVTVVAFAPLGFGMLTGKIRSPDDLAEKDWRRTVPRFSAENFPKNLRIVDEFERLAKQKGCTSAQLALAWVMSQGAIPIPGTRSAKRVEENWGAGNVELSPAELAELRTLINDAKPTGEKYSPEVLKAIGH